MALVTPCFMDTTVLVGGIIELGMEAAQRIMEAVANEEMDRPHTAWHCCLEFFAVTTRLPPALRIRPEDAVKLLREEVLARFEVHQFPGNDREAFLGQVEQEKIVGGRIYDLHIAEVARACGAAMVVTDNPRHFSTLRRDGTRVLTSSELCTEAGW